jgi:pSer/pThr/pTyr-binding forkhead associated (FHA) protein
VSDLLLEIVEGPGAGRQAPLAGPLEVGRDRAAGMALEDELASRRHVRVSPEEGGALVEDLGSLNGTFVNGEEIHAPTRVRPGDQVLVGVTVLELRTADQVEAQPTAARAVPPALAAPAREPDYVASDLDAIAPAPAASPLDSLLDSRAKAKARTAALALFVLAALAVLVFLATR